MQLTNLSVANFKAITLLSITDIKDAVVLAGPNGCGKSCILDAIRLLKSAYGSYAQDEFQMWLSEFQIDLNRQSGGELLGMFQDKKEPLRIAADFQLSDRERSYLRENLQSVIATQIRQEQRQPIMMGMQNAKSRAATDRAILAEQERRFAELSPIILPALERAIHRAELKIGVDGSTLIGESRLLELIFNTYDPQNIGVIDYHSANRTYNRHRLDNVNLTIEASADNQKNHALYNSNNKYANLKTEMTAAYIRHLLASQADPLAPVNDSLTVTLKELFSTFFPGKEFLGPQPTADGRLTFLVKLRSGGQHDIDDLSSGEKEVVYGYLKLHNSAPRDSMILIDEPELHLNPRLVSGLAAFYYRHLGSTHGNQLWLVSHSDTLIREAVAHPSFSVFHIQPPVDEKVTSQATLVTARDELERVIFSLVGDLAAYRPGAKVVIFESTEEVDFDARMTNTLFPEFEQATNSIAGGSKRKVADLYSVLETARTKGHLDAKFFSIVDADDEEIPSRAVGRNQWDRYHIENYLLEPRFIRAALIAVNIGKSSVLSETEIEGALKRAAGETVDQLILHRLRAKVNSQLVSSIHLSIDPNVSDKAASMSAAILRSRGRIESQVLGSLSVDALRTEIDEQSVHFKKALESEEWKKVLRGRDILRRFAGQHLPGMQYEYFRDLVINKMAEAGFRPKGMQLVVESILNQSLVGEMQ